MLNRTTLLMPAKWHGNIPEVTKQTWSGTCFLSSWKGQSSTS